MYKLPIILFVIISILSCQKKQIEIKNENKTFLEFTSNDQAYTVENIKLNVDNNLCLSFRLSNSATVKIVLNKVDDGIYTFGKEDTYPAFATLELQNELSISNIGKLELKKVVNMEGVFINATSTFSTLNSNNESIQHQLNFNLKVNS
jgi:hypothetical protein